MSNRSKHSPPDRGISHNNGSDDDMSTSSTRDKFRRERSLDDGTYIDSYEPKSNDYGRHSSSKRHLRSPSPDIDRRRKYRRTSPMSSSPPPLPPLTQHHSHRYRGNYTRSNRDHDRDSDGRDAEGDHYIPNYDRDGYTPGARYGRNTEPKQQQNHHHQRNRRRHSQLPPQHQHQQRHPHHQVQQNSTQVSNYGALENMMVGSRSPMSRVPVVDFQQLDYVVPFKQYCDYLRQTQPKAQFTDDDFQKQYDDYKEKINNKQLAKFFTNNKEKQWFLEKYHPQISKVRLDDMKERRLQNFGTFMQRLEQGHYDTVKYDVDSNNNNNNSNKDIEVASNADKADMDDINGDNKSLTTDVTNDSSNVDYANHLVIKTVPPTISRQKIIDMCNQVDGFQYLALSEPSVTKKFHRIGWIHFAEKTDMQKVFDELDNQKIDDFVFHLAMNRKNQSTAGRTSREAPEITNTLDRLTLDLDQATQLAKKMDTELEKDGLQAVIDRACHVIDNGQLNSRTTTTTIDDDDGDRNSADDNDDEVDTLTISTKKKLDLILAYLRLVHMYCYYCGLECDSTEELNRRCLDPHLRKLSTSGVSESKQSSKNERMTQQWIKNLDQRIEMKIGSLDDENVVKIGGKSMKSEIDAFLADHVEKEHDAKYKCKVGDCAKAFKGIEFVEKHICSKHSDEIQRLKDNVMFYNNYACDPNHLVMTSSSSNNINNNNNNGNNNYGIISASGHMGSMMNNGSNGNSMVYNGGGGSGGGNPSFMMNISPMQAAAVGTPWDQIPRIGFGGNVGWSAPMAGRLGGRLGANGSGAGKGQTSSTSDMLLDMPQDPREVKSYVDLDAPTDGDSNISFY